MSRSPRKHILHKDQEEGQLRQDQMGQDSRNKDHRGVFCSFPAVENLKMAGEVNRHVCRFKVSPTIQLFTIQCGALR